MTNIYINRYNRKKNRPDLLSFDEIEDYYIQENGPFVDYLQNPACEIDEIFRNLVDDDIRRLSRQGDYWQFSYWIRAGNFFNGAGNVDCRHWHL